MSVLVTGGAGFIGGCLCEELVKRGYDVSVLDNFSSGHKGNIEHLLDDHSCRFRLFVGDCTRAGDVSRALEGVGVVFHFAALILRFANVVGSRSGHGVIFDFVKKLRENLGELEILGDGSQAKSYLYVDDCVGAVLTAFECMRGRVEVLNVGSEDQVSVREIAGIVVEELELKDVGFRFTGGVDGGRGWVGDVKNMLLDVTKLEAKGWKPKYNSKEAVRQTARWIKT